MADGQTPLVDARDQRLADVNSSTYEQTVRSVLDDFIDRVDVETIEQITTSILRQYARSLASAEQLSPATAARNFTIVRAFLSWCVRERLIDRNPAAPSAASEPLPEPDTAADHEQQFWEPQDRDQLLRNLDRQLDRALDDAIDVPPLKAQRDQVFSYLIGLTGVRGAEILRTSGADHPRRQGLRWEHVDLDDGVLEVLGKSRDLELVGLHPDVVDRFERWHTRLQPPNKAWPVLPTLHRPTLTDRLSTVPDPATTSALLTACHDQETVPPAISTESGRYLLKQYSDRWGLPQHGTGAYLKPHGARRGLGNQLYTDDPTLAQDVLRHQSIETTHRAYRSERAKRRREDLEDALDR